MPRVLIADDDPVSLRFLAAAVAELGCEVVAVADGSGALATAQAHSFDLLLLDRRMPDLGGTELLAAMRAHGIAAPAIATSAEVDTTIAAQLRSAGFVDIIEKPATLAQLQRSVRPHLYFSAGSSTTVPVAAQTGLLDDEAALAAIGGDAAALSALRGLLAEEIATLSTQLTDFDPRIDSVPLRERLHRLRASCGFCGAVALADAARRLDSSLRDDPQRVPPILADFLGLCHATHAALCAQVAAVADDTRTSPSIPQARKPAPSR